MNIDIAGLNVELDPTIKKYINNKIGHLDRFMPRSVRKLVRAEVKLHQAKVNSGNKYDCEAILHMPEKQIVARESTVNMFAAVDIVEAKLKNQITKYKQEHILKKRRPRFLKRLISRNTEEEE